MTLLNNTHSFTSRPRTPAACNTESETTVRPRYTVAPAADASAWTLTVALPGVAKTGLSVTDEAGVLTIHGERTWKCPETWTVLHRESADASFSLALHHDGEIDVGKIKADFAGGILTVTLPKAEALKPRKIAIN
ncbi:MAG: Hsp20/alpha crystallin family protein [Opitutaceae bacterium]|jgi:HSP20 family molecular chaperone IbpA|nr:Hsp20/alpha crystallin family protein [Opitutaceae bacterium]